MSIEPTGYVARTPQPLSPEGTLIAVIEMGRDKWLVSAVVPGLDRRPIKVTLERELGVMKLLAGWRSEVERSGAKIDRVVVAYGERRRRSRPRRLRASPRPSAARARDLRHPSSERRRAARAWPGQDRSARHANALASTLWPGGVC